MEWHRDYVSSLYLIPISTLLTQAQSVARDVSKRDVLWEDWGPSGAQVLRFRKPCHSISAFGSKCAIAFSRFPSEPAFEIFVVNLPPCVKSKQDMGDSDVVAAQEFFRFVDPVEDTASCPSTRRSLPCSILHKVIRDPAFLQPSNTFVTLTDDGIVLIVRSSFRVLGRPLYADQQSQKEGLQGWLSSAVFALYV